MICVIRGQRVILDADLARIYGVVTLREQLVANVAILKRLAEIDKTLLEHDSALRTIWTKLQPLLAPPPDPPKRRIGFNPDNQ